MRNQQDVALKFKIPESHVAQRLQGFKFPISRLRIATFNLRMYNWY
jgi:hypothetical protein